MNYRTMVKGALALSLSLTVGTASAFTTSTNSVPIYGATFEAATSETAPLNDYAYEEGTNITKYANAQLGKGWFGAEDDESKIIAGGVTGGSQALQLNTDANTLTNKFDSDIASDLNTAITGNGAYFETDVKFVASDTLDAGITGGQDSTKFAIYAYCDDQAETVTTNLVVFHGIMGGNGVVTYTNEVFDTLIDCDVYTKLRIEMKKATNPSTFESVNVFSVKVGNGDALTSNLAFADGIWFLTVEDPLDDDAAEVSSLNFKGTGEIDNVVAGTIALDTTYAIDWTGSENVVVSNGEAEVTGTVGNFANGTVLTFYPTVGLITNANNVALDPAASNWTFTVSNADATFTVFAGEAQQQEKPAWADDADDTAFWKWVEDHADGVDLTTDYSAQYLMNVDTDKTPVLKIDSIVVTDEGSQIVISATDGTNAINLDDINGVLNVFVGDSVTALTKKAIPEDNVTFANNKATVIILSDDGAFAKASVDYTAPSTSLEEVTLE